MTPEKVKSVLSGYQARLRLAGFHPRQMPERQYTTIAPTGYDTSHVAWMCVEAQLFVDQGRIEKAMRWLGFIQGYLFCNSYKTLDDLKNDSKPDSESSANCSHCYSRPRHDGSRLCAGCFEAEVRSAK